MQRGICYVCNYRNKRAKLQSAKSDRPSTDEDVSMNTESVESSGMDVAPPAAKRHCEELAPPNHTDVQKQPLFQVIVCESWGVYDLSHLMVLWLPVTPDRAAAAMPVLDADTKLPEDFSSFQPLLETWNKHVHVIQLSMLKDAVEAETLDSPGQTYSEKHYTDVVRFIGCCAEQLEQWGDMLINVQCGVKFDHELHYVREVYTLNVIHERV